MKTVKAYSRVEHSGEFELEVKRSRFIVKYCPVDSREQSLAFVEQWRKAYPDARHHCWALCIGHPLNPRQVAMSDDGEPSGTAAKPMLNAIIGKGIGDICVVVVRYFGGTKLGAGGLIRAYGGSVSKALDQAKTEIIKPKIGLKLFCDFSLEQKIRHWLSNHQGVITNVVYDQTVTICILIEVAFVDDLKTFAHAYGIRYQ